MLHNDFMPRIDIDAERFDVRINNQRIDLKPAQNFALGQLYWFS
jgi:urease alpha subunit